MAGQCLEFEYRREGADATSWRRVIPVGLIHGPVTYVIGKLSGKEMEPVPYRLDRMSDIRASNEAGCVPDDWDLDRWMAGSFGIWREDAQDIVLRVDAAAAQRARQWRFHPQQVVEDGQRGQLIVRFRSGGLREIAEHLFTWGGDVRIESPDELRETMRQRLAEAQGALQ
ncbi:WYL domain-containing protein [Pseudopontixanthobacter vadosimaris]|uniref:WYL domain-containing protein n=1 Tax=Pseudopontixanthobacter vadosimaris TaxID=2726450 RepID=UPI0014759199|nr:WYL domain-containing protein [Pseudopontixanthobacter vadosimaris]